jgi:hypothetical protein
VDIWKQLAPTRCCVSPASTAEKLYKSLLRCQPSAECIPGAVIDLQISGQPGVVLLGVRVGHGVSPLLAQGKNEPCNCAVCAGYLEPSADVPEVLGAPGLGESLEDIGGAVVAHHPKALDALGVEPGDSTPKKTDQN